MPVPVAVDGSLTWPVRRRPPAPRSRTGPWSGCRPGKRRVPGDLPCLPAVRWAPERGRHRGCPLLPPPEVWLEPRLTRECPGRAPGPRRRCRRSPPLRSEANGSGTARRAGPRPSPNGHVGNALAPRSAPPGAGREGPGPAPAAPLPAHVFGTGSPPAALECARAPLLAQQPVATCRHTGRLGSRAGPGARGASSLDAASTVFWGGQRRNTGVG